MKRHTDTLAQAEAESVQSTSKSKSQSDEPPERFFEEFVLSLTQLSERHALNPADDAMKRSHRDDGARCHLYEEEPVQTEFGSV